MKHYYRKIADAQEPKHPTRDFPLPISVIPNNMGINLCSVAGMSWNEEDDGQLRDLTIHFIPKKEKEIRYSKYPKECKCEKRDETKPVEVIDTPNNITELIEVLDKYFKDNPSPRIFHDPDSLYPEHLKYYRSNTGDIDPTRFVINVC